MKSSSETGYPTLPENEVFDVAIVGAGIVGVFLARELAGKGQRVALIEAERALEGVTGFTTGKLTSQHGFIYHKVEQSLGLEQVRHYFEANQWAIEDIRKRVEEEGIDCDFTPAAAHVVVSSDAGEAALDHEVRALAKAKVPYEVVPGPDPRHGGRALLRFTHQAHFHPRNFLLHQLEAAAEKGVEVFENSRIENIEEGGERCILQFRGTQVFAKQVVVATHYPIHDSGFFVAKLAPYRSYAIAVRLNEPVPPGMFIGWEEESFHSTRPTTFEGEPALIVGGENHKVGQETESVRRFADLEAWANAQFDVKEVLARWSTQDNWTPDGRPFIGKSPNRERIFLATGFGGWGMTTGRVAANVLAAMLEPRIHPWQHLYDPSRIGMDMAPDLVKENLNVAKHLIGGKLGGVDASSPEKLAPGESRIFQTSDGRIAAHRDLDGTLHRVHAECTHMGCQVTWNEAESSWDCPCHGSRFGPDGQVLHPPAVKPLKPVTDA